MKGVPVRRAVPGGMDSMRNAFGHASRAMIARPAIARLARLFTDNRQGARATATTLTA